MDAVRQDGAGEITVLQEVDTPSSVGQDVAILTAGGHNNAVALHDHNQQAGAATATVVDAAGAANANQPTKFVVIHLPIFHVATPSAGDQGGVVSTSPQQHHLIQHNSAVTSVGGGQHIPSSAAAVILQHTPSSVITSAGSGGLQAGSAGVQAGSVGVQHHNLLDHATATVVSPTSELNSENGGGGAGDPGVGSFQCKECGKRFPKEDLLRDHFRWHIEGELSKSHRCEQCGATFSFKSNFELHKRTCNVNGFKCGLCEKVFSTRAQHSSHLRREHAAKPYSRSGKSKSARGGGGQQNNAVVAVKQQPPPAVAAPQQQTTTLTIPTSAVVTAGGGTVTGTPRVVTTAEGTMVYVDVKHEPQQQPPPSYVKHETSAGGGAVASADQQLHHGDHQLLQVHHHQHHGGTIEQHHHGGGAGGMPNSIVVTETLKLEGE